MHVVHVLVRTCVLLSFPSFWIFVAMLSIETLGRGYLVYMDTGLLSTCIGDEFKPKIEELSRHDW